ncbi:MAG: CsiV family protein [Pseudomonadota bacterium]
MLLAWNSPSLADDHEVRWYDVEVVVFENLNVPRSDNTYWAVQAYVPELRGAISLGRDADSLANLGQSSAEIDESNELGGVSLAPRLLSESYHRLTAEAKTIARSSRYRLLVHQAWRQAGTPLDDAIPVQIVAGDPVPVFAPTNLEPQPASDDLPQGLSVSNPLLTGANAEKAPVYTPPPVDGFRPVFTRPPGNQISNYKQMLAHPLDGTITVALGRYLHVYTNLALTRSRKGASGTALQSYIAKGHRRMRSRTLHYIDHPEIGVLVTITPYETDAES